MRVAVDARTVYSAVRRGTGKNLIDLYRCVARLRPDWSFLMIHRRGFEGDDPFAEAPNIAAVGVEMPGDRWHAWQHVRLPLAARAWKADVLHAPANTAPRFPLVPLVVTIHDLIPLDIVANSVASRRWEREVGYGVSRARRILTPSVYTRDRLVGHYGVQPGKIVVNPWAPDSSLVRIEDPAEIDRVRQRYGLRLGQPYVLCFGAADPRKNTRRVLEAWSRIDPAVRHRAALLVVGLDGAALQPLREWMSSLLPEGGWSLAGFADEADMPALISGATALCYPSLSEGFGLPVLDAFACDTPVITSRATSLPEVAGDAAVLVDPTDTEAIGRAMADLITRPELARDLRARGRRRLEEYSWDRCARTAIDTLAAAA
ncbi:MAG: glycosyltransferase family 4 protein [Acidobacteria bacterium]|nr:glycosyltransferase family 4 protein [Acidobacteriota bacterium]